MPSSKAKRTVDDVESPDEASSAEDCPRPANSWILYRKDRQEELTQGSLTIHLTPGSTGRPGRGASTTVFAKMWAAEPPEVKARYERLALEAKAEHARMYPGYKYQPKRKRKDDASMGMDKPAPKRRRKQQKESTIFDRIQPVGPHEANHGSHSPPASQQDQSLENEQVSASSGEMSHGSSSSQESQHAFVSQDSRPGNSSTEANQGSNLSRGSQYHLISSDSRPDHSNLPRSALGVSINAATDEDNPFRLWWSPHALPPPFSQGLALPPMLAYSRSLAPPSIPSAPMPRTAFPAGNYPPVSIQPVPDPQPVSIPPVQDLSSNQVLTSQGGELPTLASLLGIDTLIGADASAQLSGPIQNVPVDLSDYLHVSPLGLRSSRQIGSGSLEPAQHRRTPPAISPSPAIRPNRLALELSAYQHPMPLSPCPSTRNPVPTSRSCVHGTERSPSGLFLLELTEAGFPTLFSPPQCNCANVLAPDMRAPVDPSLPSLTHSLATSTPSSTSLTKSTNTSPDSSWNATFENRKADDEDEDKNDLW
ncbi:hypothetical protein OC861_003616 [Tilletia horrida]|nr:hypothetical protein OC861_003616 [Tilletia horrida]